MREKKHHQKSQNFQVATHVIMHNEEIQIRTDNQTFDLDVAEITPNTVDKNSCSDNLYIWDLKTGSTIDTFLSSKKVCNVQTH
jgi:hypothetical protein